MQPALLILAAGMGSRYGGLKQIDPVGPGGEAILDYSLFDAIRAGFGKIVFVIRKDIEAPFREFIASKNLPADVPVEYVFQELASPDVGVAVPEGRTKPWGTGHAILMGREVIDTPFAAINADDFYGADSFQILYNYLKQARDRELADYCMVGFRLANTLSPHGAVSRGVCACDSENTLKTVTETTHIEQNGSDAKYTDDDGAVQELTGKTTVSMNMWGFTPGIFDHLHERFAKFMATRATEEKSEFYIPSVVADLIAEKKARVEVLPTPELWFGVTYKEDKPYVEGKIAALIEQGRYPEKLWG